MLSILDVNLGIEDLKILHTALAGQEKRACIICKSKTQIESKNNKASKLYIQVLANDKTYLNVDLQCVAKGDLYSRAVFYSSSLMIHHSASGKGYTEPNVISIWIIRDRIKSGIIANRISPIEEIVHCTLPTKWNEGHEVFISKSRIIWVQLAKIKNNEKIKASISKELRDWAEFFSDQNAIESEDEGMKDAQKLWNRISANDQLKAQLRAEEKYQRDKDSELVMAKEEGAHEKAIETAKNFLKMGLSAEQVAKETGLSMEDINKLQ